MTPVPAHAQLLPRGAVTRQRSTNEGRERSRVHRCAASSGPVITVAFPLQSPDRKKALTAQRTFDSEGESKHPGRVIAPFDFLSQTCCFFSPSSPFFCVGVLQRRSYTRTTRRRPYTTTRTRSSGSPNPTKTSWCSTGPSAPPGASSVWSGTTLTPSLTFLHRSLTVYTLECSRSEECCHIQSGCGTYPSSHSCCLPLPLMLFIREDGSGASSCGWAGGRSDPQEVSGARSVFEMFSPELR